MQSSGLVSPDTRAPRISTGPDSGRESALAALAREIWTALCGLVRSPRYSVPAVLSLALGIGASTAVFAVFSGLVLRPLPFPEPKRLVTLGIEAQTPAFDLQNIKQVVSPRFAAEFAEQKSLFSGVSSCKTFTGWVDAFGVRKRYTPLQVSLDYFDTLGVGAVQGRTFTAAPGTKDSTATVVMRHRFWLEAFGGQPIIDKTIVVDGEPRTVVGIVADEQALPWYTDLWVPTEFPLDAPRFALFINALARLADGVSVEDAQARLNSDLQQRGIRDDGGNPVRVVLMPLDDYVLGPQSGVAALMLAAVLAFLLMAGANVASLLGTRASVQGAENAVRMALGASRLALARQSVLDALALALAGGAGGLAIAAGLIHAANVAYSESLANTPARLDGRVLLGFAGLLTAVTIIGALAPVLRTLRQSPMAALQGFGRSSGSRGARRVRELLLGLQVAVTVVLLVSSGLLIRSIHALQNAPMGFDQAHVATAWVMLPWETPPQSLPPELVRREYEGLWRREQKILERLQREPGVEHASLSQDIPFDFLYPTMKVRLEPGAVRNDGVVQPHSITPKYFETLGVHLLAGRALRDGDLEPQPLRADGYYRPQPVAVVNRAFVEQLLGQSNPIGHRFVFRQFAPDFEPDRLEIVGVVEDVLESDLATAPVPAVYVPIFGTADLSSVMFAVRTAEPVEDLVHRLPQIIQQTDSKAVVSFNQPLATWVEKSYWRHSALQRVLVTLALAAFVLAAVGLFGVTSYAVAQRRHEIGIRRALGANRVAIVRLILWETGAVVALGLVVGFGLAWCTKGLLQAFLFGITAADPLTYLAVGCGVPVVSLLAAVVPAIAAAAVPPVESLQGERWRSRRAPRMEPTSRALDDDVASSIS